MYLPSPWKQVIFCSLKRSKCFILSFPWSLVTGMPLPVILDDPSEAETIPASIIAYGTVGKESYKPFLTTVLLKLS